MKKYQFEQNDIEKIDYLIKAVNEVKEKYKIYDINLEIFSEYDSKVKKVYKLNSKPNKELKEKRWSARHNFDKALAELNESAKKWNNEMEILYEKYNYIKLSDFYENMRYSGNIKPPKEFNYTVNLVAKTIKIPLLFEINIGYGKVNLTNLYPKLWLELNGKELFEQSKNILLVTDYDRFKK
jgi:hypothetical protein